MNNRKLIILLSLIALSSCWFPVCGKAGLSSEINWEPIGRDTFSVDGKGDSLSVKKAKTDFFHRIGSFFTKYFRDFNETDTTYIESQHYNFAFMMQNTNTYEVYRISSKSGQEISFAPKPTYRVGPFFGWRWFFLGYTFDVRHLSNNNNKREFDLSLYSNLMGVDLYYRKTGTDYSIRSFKSAASTEEIKRLDIPFSGLNVGITGFDLYYIFNHRKFSYPAAFSQSTVQRKSCGTALAGIGYTRHSIDLDFRKLQNVIDNEIPNRMVEKNLAVKLDSGLMFENVKYTNFSVSGGYAYNWVFAHNWLLCSSLSLSMGYKRASGDLKKDELTILRDFSFKNVVLDGTWRLGVVWNNTKWFGGMSTILHSYNYKKRQFSTDNIFGSINFYFGFNFDRKR